MVDVDPTIATWISQDPVSTRTGKSGENQRKPRKAFKNMVEENTYEWHETHTLL